MNKTVLRLVTTGSVDDGKSTLIGRLLYETNCIPEDQYEAVARYSKQRGKEDVDLSFLLDGLESEREQGITIDVAYRYFETTKRKFIVADTPGHEQYTRNMVTGASNADAAMILIDARNGVLTQSKRHGFLLSLLGVKHLIVVINKMDLVFYSKKRYDEIKNEYDSFCSNLNISDITYVPVSALKGDNVSSLSDKMIWYKGKSVLDMLETLTIHDSNTDFRFPVQLVIRAKDDFRGYAGKVCSGSISVGEEVIVLPSMKTSTITSITDDNEKLNLATFPQSVVLTINDQIDIDRGDMICRKHNVPTLTNGFDAILCWMDNSKLVIDKKYILKHTTKKVNAYVRGIHYIVDVNTTHRIKTNCMSLNDVGKVFIELSDNIYADLYGINRYTGSFILIDPDTKSTIASGMIKSFNVDNIKKKDYKTVWFTGMPCSGKTTIAEGVNTKLKDLGYNVITLDGDDVRQTLNSDLGFSDKDRKENIRRISHMSNMLNKKGISILCSFVSPTEEIRNIVKANVENLILVYVKASKEECAKRDVKGMWKQAKDGIISDFSGHSSNYEEPLNPDIILDTERLTINECVDRIIEYL
jgi:bifunctional enzyme CysN/CysC